MNVQPEKRGDCDRHLNVCKDILYDLRLQQPHETRIDRNKLKSQCIAEAISAGDNVDKWLRPSPSFGESNEANMNEFCIHAANKFSVEITYQADKDTITRFIQNGIFNFGIDLFYGSVQQNVDVVTRLKEAVLRESEKSGFSIPLSIYLRISPRKQFTGRLKCNKTRFLLKPNSQVLLTTDRRYASRCCRSIIYVNARFLLVDLQKCDVILVGNSIELQVVKIEGDKVTCTVIAAGEVTNRMPVRFSRKFEWAHSRISAEELEDLSFAMGVGINVIVANTPGSPCTCAQIRGTLAEFKCSNYYLFTRLTLKHLDSYEYSDVKWMVDDFDGFLLDCTEGVPHDNIVKLPKVVHKFFEKTFARRKPFFLAGCWSLFVHSTDYAIAFYYPDKYILPCKSDFLHLYETFSYKFALEKCVEEGFRDNSLTGSGTIARSIAAASFEFHADAIIMCAVTGKMAEKIAHFRPEVPIIAVTNVSGAVNFACMHHNIWMLLFDAEKSLEISHKKDVHQKLVYGLEYALKKKLISHTSKIILAYRKVVEYGFTDKFVVIKFTDNYDEVIRNCILAK